MPDTTIAFDHVHLLAEDPHETARWYVDKLGGTILRSVDMKGAPQVYVALAGAMVLVRGQRPGEEVAGKPGLEWGLDHFGVRVKGDFDAFCARLRSQGVEFSMEPTDINAHTRIAFIEAPDGVSIELLDRKDQREETS